MWSCADTDGGGAGAVAAEIGWRRRHLRCRQRSGRRAAGGRGTRARYGRIDAIVSNAGIGAFGPLETTSLEAWNRVLATNLTATFLLAKAAAVELRQTRGAIVTIASTRAHMSEPNTLAYSASKGGLVALTHALAMTLAPEVRVNCVSPGWIDTGKHGPSRRATMRSTPWAASAGPRTLRRPWLTCCRRRRGS